MISTRKVFVAGGTGVLGRRVVPLLVQAGHNVMVNTRSVDAAAKVKAAGASSITVDLFDADAVAAAVEGFDAIVNVATAIPTGVSAAMKRGWLMNDRLRTEASANLADALDDDGHYVGESITFPYADRGEDWIDESVARDTTWATLSIEATEAAAASVDGVTLRFGMFWAPDSGHNTMLMAGVRRGLFLLFGNPAAYCSWIHIDDAAAAVIAALDAPPGIYNVAEPDPLRRADHMAALATAVGRKKLRPTPKLALRLGGAPVEALARSQRISSAALSEATDWQAQHRIVEHWA